MAAPACRKKKSASKPSHSLDRFVPYRLGLPPIPDSDMGGPPELRALEELAMEEEFLQWASYMFRDGST